MKKAVIGILAHVDAGKTTLSESMLYLSGKLRKQGRVDHKDTFLDYNDQEKNRGITIFSKQAQFEWNDTLLTLIDTPGHVDFSSEMERTLSILDYAILLINGMDGIQNHTKTIWELLKHYQIPTILFINKMDIRTTNKEQLMNQLIQQLDDQCYDHQCIKDYYENIALCSEEILNEYLESDEISSDTIYSLVNQRQIFPCFFGSALKNDGVEDFLNHLTSFVQEKKYSSSFKAKVFKITYDEQKNRLTHIKITGGTLHVKDEVNNEKVDQIRIYEGLKYKMVDEVHAGDICSIKGFKNIQAGHLLGEEYQDIKPILSPYMSYTMILPKDVDYHLFVSQIKQIADEDPSLQLKILENKEIQVSLMGEIQIEILKSMILERFNVSVEFDQGQIIYKETLRNSVEGVGHFEPLRHYAEVHLLLEPLPRGEGLIFESKVKEDLLEKRFQRLILTHLNEKEHIGVLTGSPITDLKITVVSGKAHLKHTEGGDFREATYRAIRQGLKMGESILLEPYYAYKLEIPQNYLSKAIFDIENMDGTYIINESSSDIVYLSGEAPVRKMQNYQREVISYTSGKGRLYCSLSSYKECIDEKEIIESIQYNSEADTLNPTGSIFCSHGAGYYVNYDEVYDHMHIPLQQKETYITKTTSYSSSLSLDDELQNIFERTYGPTKTKLYEDYVRRNEQVTSNYVKAKQECLLVDGYNVIHAWDELREIALDNLDHARNRLIDLLGNYQGYKQNLIIIVFDAYKVKGNIGSYEQLHNLHIVYTKEAQTADMYIERATHDLSKEYNVVVATSDALEQMIVIGRGARRMSSRELKLEVEYLTKMKFEEYEKNKEKSRNFLLEDIKNYRNE